MSTLRETLSKWGDLYRRRYYLDGRRVSEAEATRLLDAHYHEQVSSGRTRTGNLFTTWNIGPRADAPPLADHPDLR